MVMIYDTKMTILREIPLTDNVFTVKSWLKEKSCIEESELNSRFGIPEDLDYMD